MIFWEKENFKFTRKLLKYKERFLFGGLSPLFWDESAPFLDWVLYINITHLGLYNYPKSFAIFRILIKRIKLKTNMPLISAYSAVLAIIVLIVAARAFTERVRLKRANLSPYGGIKKLEGLLVVITGASSGIGEQLAYMYARKKCRLYLIALESALLDNVRENCLKLGAASVRDFFTFFF